TATASMPWPIGPTGAITVASSADGAVGRRNEGSKSASCPSHQLKNSRNMIGDRARSNPCRQRFIVQKGRRCGKGQPRDDRPRPTGTAGIWLDHGNRDQNCGKNRRFHSQSRGKG